jgi:hypothetical protein
VQPFGVGSYERQLRVIWQGAASDRCAGKLWNITSRHIATGHRSWTADVAELATLRTRMQNNAAGYEKNFLGDGTFSVAALHRILQSCASIGCVQNTLGERFGTGFLIAGDSLSPSFGSGPVFVTNAHVLGESGGVQLKDARIRFELDTPPVREHRIAEQLFHSPPGDFGVCCPATENLDTVVVRLEALPAAAPPLPRAISLPLLDARARAFVIGHPKGAALQVSLHDSLLVDFDEEQRLVHYRTPTDPGSSGSPVFNELWEVIALHHGGSRRMPRLRGAGSYEANEGIGIGAIQRGIALRAQ